MRRWLALAVAGLVVLGSAACGGGSNTKTVKGPDGQEVKVSGGGSLPSDFPKDFPIYDGADYKGGLQSTQQGVSGFYATWETGDSLDKVQEWYTGKLKDGTWKSTTTINSGDTHLIGFEDKDDSSRTGFVSISKADNKTVIGVIVGKDSGGGSNGDSTPSSSEEDTPTSSDGGEADTPEANATAPAEVDLPSGYPKDRVPLPDGARVTSATSISSGGQELYTIEFYSKDDAKSVADYFKAEMPKHNWENALTSESNGQYFLNWGDGAGEETVTVTVEASDVSGYSSKASMLVTVKAS